MSEWVDCKGEWEGGREGGKEGRREGGEGRTFSVPETIWCTSSTRRGESLGGSELLKRRRKAPRRRPFRRTGRTAMCWGREGGREER